MAKSLLLFVHGIDGSSSATWGSFPALIRADGELSARYDVALDNYPTRKTGRVFERIGGLDTAAEGLKTRLANRHANYDDIAIIAHSQGGLIVLRYMLDQLLRTEPMPLSRLLTFATPYAGATGGSLGAFFGIGSAQAKDLASEGDFLLRLNRDWGLFRGQHRVSMKAVIAGCDGVVGGGSAAALGIPYELVAAGNHQTIVKPDSARHESFLIAKRFLLDVSADRRGAPPLKHAIKLPDELREALQDAWEKLDERLRQISNSWRDEWAGVRSRFEAAFAKAAETGLAECWQAVIEAGSDFREEIRAGVEDESDLPAHYTALTVYTDKVQKVLKVARATPGNALPPEHEKLIAGIETLEEKAGNERVILAEASAAADVPSARQHQINELFRRLDEVEKDLAASKRKAIQVEQVNIVNVDPASVIALVRDALEALKHGIDLLEDKRFTETLRRAAMTAWITARNYVAAVRQRFGVLRLPWRQEQVFEDIERREPSFGLPSDNPPSSGASSDASLIARDRWGNHARDNPRASGARPKRDVKVSEAIAYLITNIWNLNFMEAHHRAVFDVVPEFRRFHQAAADGLFTVWGRSGLARPYAPIPAAFWIENDISFSSVMKGEAESEPHNDRDFTQTRFIRLMASRVEIERFFESQPPELVRAKSVARQLSKLLDAGVEHRNRLLAPLKPFDHQAEMGILIKWNEDVISRFDSVDVPEGERSRFATLDTWNEEIHGAPERDPQQVHLETMWNKKLQILRSILDNVKIEYSHRTG